MAIDYEAPFLYLLFGEDRAVLIDTGATTPAEYFPLRRVVDGLIGDWLRAHPRDTYPLPVLHTHAHDDHVAGDAQFADRPDTDVDDAERDGACRASPRDQDTVVDRMHRARQGVSHLGRVRLRLAPACSTCASAASIGAA